MTTIPSMESITLMTALDREPALATTFSPTHPPVPQATFSDLSAFRFQCFLTFFVTTEGTALAKGFVLGFSESRFSMSGVSWLTRTSSTGAMLNCPGVELSYSCVVLLGRALCSSIKIVLY